MSFILIFNFLFYAFILIFTVMVQMDFSLLFLILKYYTLCFLQLNVF